MRKIKHGKLAAGCADSCCLKLEGLSVQLQGERILQDVSFHLHCGEIAALIGPNGAGKSSLFRCILGQMPYQGKITFSPARGPAIPLSAPLTGYVPQAPSFDRGDPVSVLDFFTAATSRWPVFLPIPGKYRERAERCLERVHGADLLDRPMGGLSGGQLQRVLLAMALEPIPHILILDEPLSGVDIEGEHQLLEMLDELRTQYDLSILFSTHDFATLGQFADKVILLNQGVVKIGTPDQVLAAPEFYETFHLRLGHEKGGGV
jgi:zinc transport system ATP-binding protein